MRSARDIVGKDGALLVYENASPGEETRERMDGALGPAAAGLAQRSTTLSGTQSRTDHVHVNDFPETDATWRALGHVGRLLRRAPALYACPTDLFRLYCFRA